MPGCWLLVVRATVPEDDRAAFDAWYGGEHLGDAMRTFGARAAWRGWSTDDPAAHVAVYEFATEEEARAASASPGLARLIAVFEARWKYRVPRTRDVICVAQTINA